MENSGSVENMGFSGKNEVWKTWGTIFPKNMNFVSLNCKENQFSTGRVKPISHFVRNKTKMSCPRDVITAAASVKVWSKSGHFSVI